MGTNVVNPSTPFGYIIMENDNTFQDVSKLEVVKEDYLFYVKFVATMQSLDTTNRNKRWYAGDAVWASLTTPEVFELLKNRKLQSEMGHPIDGTPARIATVDSKNACNLILRFWREGNLIKADIETLDDGMYGTKLTKSILQGVNPSYSYRAFAILDKKGNISYVRKPPKFITYDEVNLPSHKEAYADPKKQKVVKSFSGAEKVIESSQIVLQDASKPIFGSDVQSLLLRDSDNAKVVCESFGLDPSSFTPYGNHSFSIKAGSDTFIFQAEREVAKRYADIWTRM